MIWCSWPREIAKRFPLEPRKHAQNEVPRLALRSSLVTWKRCHVGRGSHSWVIQPDRV